MTIDDIGCCQLESAIELFFAEKYVSALTLAVAAEEVLGRLVESRCNTPNASERYIGLIQDIGRLRLFPEDDPAETEISRKGAHLMLNFARNSVKHWNSESDAYESDLDFKEAAKDMLDRACSNYSDLYPGDFSNCLVERFMTYQVDEIKKT